MKIKLSRDWVEYLLKLPETGMGYQKIDITLKDGRIIRNLIVYNAEELDLPDDYATIKSKDIAKIELVKNNVLTK
jgi:hypothetical protein